MQNVNSMDLPTREMLLNALYASASEVPAWSSFTRTAQLAFNATQVALVVSSDPSEPVITLVDEKYTGIIETLAARSSEMHSEGQPRSVEIAGGRALILSVDSDASRHAAIILWRSNDVPPFENSDIHMVASLAEPLRRSLKIYLRCAELFRRASMNEVALETSRIGAALVSIDGALLMANSVAEELISRREGLYLSHGRLHARNTAETAGLMSEIQRCALNQTATNDPLHFVPLSFDREHHSLPLTVIVRPGPAFHPLPRPLRRTAILVMRDPLAQGNWQAETIARLFGLTAAEAQLASKLARGACLKEAAAALGISQNTAKTQLQGIFMKTGLNRQTELMRALFNSAATSA